MAAFAPSSPVRCRPPGLSSAVCRPFPGAALPGSPVTPPAGRGRARLVRRPVCQLGKGDDKPSDEAAPSPSHSHSSSSSSSSPSSSAGKNSGGASTPSFTPPWHVLTERVSAARAAAVAVDKRVAANWHSGTFTQTVVGALTDVSGSGVKAEEVCRVCLAGGLLACGTTGGDVVVWALADEAEGPALPVGRWRLFDGPVTALNFDGGRVAAASGGGSVRVVGVARVVREARRRRPRGGVGGGCEGDTEGASGRESHLGLHGVAWERVAGWADDGGAMSGSPTPSPPPSASSPTTEVVAAAAAASAAAAAEAAADGPVVGAMWATGHTAAVTAIALLPGGRVASSSLDGTVCVWHAPTGALLHTVRVGAPVTAMTLGGDYLLAGTDAGRVAAFSLTASCVHVLSFDATTPAPVASLHMHDDTMRLAIGGGDGSLRLWDFQEGTLLSAVHGAHDAAVVSLQGDAYKVVSAGADGAVKVWSAVSGELWYAVVGFSEGLGSLSYEGRVLVADGTAGVLLVHEFDVAAPPPLPPLPPSSGPGPLL